MYTFWRLYGGNKKEWCTIGIDGCKGGWIVASIRDGKLEIGKFNSISEIAKNIPFDIGLIDMIIGLPDKKHQFRPDDEARNLLKPLSSTVFNAPCRKAVEEKAKGKENQTNLEELGKGLSRQTIGIIPKIREVDTFLLKNKEYQNRLMESHPELCFVSLTGYNILSKHYVKGIIDRIEILKKYLPEVTLDLITTETIHHKCKEDDIVDAICLAVTANFYKQERTQTVPAEPKKDAKGLTMQMVVPSFCHLNDEIERNESTGAK